jgi:hypothetical protein
MAFVLASAEQLKNNVDGKISRSYRAIVTTPVGDAPLALLIASGIASIVPKYDVTEQPTELPISLARTTYVDEVSPFTGCLFPSNHWKVLSESLSVTTKLQERVSPTRPIPVTTAASAR